MERLTDKEKRIVNRALLDFVTLPEDVREEVIEELAYSTPMAENEIGSCDGDCTEKVHHPSHYNQIHGVECIDVIEQMPFNTGNAMKYLWRYLDKGEPITDLQKAKWYINRELARLMGEN